MARKLNEIQLMLDGTDRRIFNRQWRGWPTARFFRRKLFSFYKLPE